MRSIIIPILFALIVLSGCNFKQHKAKDENLSQHSNFSFDYDDKNNSHYNDGYFWAENNNIDNFEDCQNQFGTSEAKDGCNDYIKKKLNYNRVIKTSKNGTQYIAGELIIITKKNINKNSFKQMINKYGGKIINSTESIGMYVVKFDDLTEEELKKIASKLKENQMVSSVALNTIIDVY